VKVASGIRRQNQKQDDAAAAAVVRRALRGCRVRRKLDSIDMISNAHLTRRNAAERERERERERECGHISECGWSNGFSDEYGPEQSKPRDTSDQFVSI